MPAATPRSRPRRARRSSDPEEVRKIAPLDRRVGEGDTITLGDTRFTVMETPGHTLGHIAYYDAQDATAFVGDTLFALGCGRLFEGTPAQMWDSLSRLARLPAETQVYCAHEYTAANARFALSVDDSEPVKARAQARVRAAREGRVDRADHHRRRACGPTPSCARPSSPGPSAAPQGDAVAAFAAMRAAKDAFKGLAGLADLRLGDDLDDPFRRWSTRHAQLGRDGDLHGLTLGHRARPAARKEAHVHDTGDHRQAFLVLAHPGRRRRR